MSSDDGSKSYIAILIVKKSNNQRVDASDMANIPAQRLFYEILRPRGAMLKMKKINKSACVLQGRCLTNNSKSGWYYLSLQDRTMNRILYPVKPRYRLDNLAHACTADALEYAVVFQSLLASSHTPAEQVSCEYGFIPSVMQLIAPGRS